MAAAAAHHHHHGNSRTGSHTTRQLSLLVPLLLLAAFSGSGGLIRHAAAAPAKWTVFVYMLADNNLEPFGLLDLEEIMAAMSMEKPGDCSFSSCGDSSCPAGKVETYKQSCAGNAFTRRCCSPGNYPDIFVMVDKGGGSNLSPEQRVYDLPHADYSQLEGYWTSVKTLVALPGGQWEQLTEEQEADLASAATISDFLQEGLRRYPPDGTRKYMAVFWDHGNGWLGYGADGKCASGDAYQDHVYCDAASLATLTAGLQAGLKHPTTGAALKLDILGFDACLMSMWEISTALAPYAHYLLGSELLEPGTGWDYSMLGYVTQGLTVSGAAVNGVTGFSEKDVAELLIEGYMVNTRGNGLTLALTDLGKVETTLDSNMVALTALLSQQMSATPALGMQLLQQRTLLGTIESAEDSVDLGALLTRLSGVTTGELKTRLNNTLEAYRAAVVAFQRDGILPDGTGMAIYFPPNTYSMHRLYAGFVADNDPADLSGWLKFLNDLYAAINLVASTGIDFLEPYAVPYWAVGSHTWITHGTLSTLSGLTADLLYGFISPTGTDFITAGTTVGRIAQYAAVGAWSGQLFGLVQDLTPGDAAVDGLALAYADEQRVTDSEGNVLQLIVQMQVYYASSCYAPITEMMTGMLKYVYDMSSQDTALTLFVSAGDNKAWGEVSTQSGGVIIPYLGSINLVTGARGSSFGYSDCLKWGYEGSISVAAFNATQAVGILGLDLTRDLATLLTVQGLSGNRKSLYGSFEPAQKTQGGCQCAQLWSYTDSNGQAVSVRGQCVNPFGHARAWCQYEPESCTGTPTAVDGQTLTDFCSAVTTLSGCKCHTNWRVNGATYNGTCANTGDPLGTWCVVDRATCGSAYRAHGFGANNTVSATIGGSATQLTGLDFDYCQVTTTHECCCSNTWEYGSTLYSGTCRTGLVGSTTIPGISADTNWCFVDKYCAKGKRIDGFTYDLCTPEGGRVTEAGVACEFPATYHGVPLYNCISYNHSTPGVATPKPWCFTDAATQAWGYCAPWTCTTALKAHCPAGSPAAVGANLTAWAVPGCLETLCNARKDLANISLCTQDSQADRDALATAYSSLASSSAFGQVLSSSSSNNGAASLDAYCSATFGQLCMDNILDPACPGLFRQNNVWMASTSKASLCDTGCLKALCVLQEQAKTSVTGSPGVAGTASSITCADGELTTAVMWSMMRLFDSTCGWPGPASLACNKLLSPPQLCEVDSQISALTGNITDGAPLGGNYSASTACSWTINMPEQPYISMNFSRFQTEQRYDVVTVEDFDGLIGRFSGSEVPSSLSTDTGMLTIKFSSDGSLQGRGFAAQYLASSTPQVNIPVCTGGAKLLQVVLRTRAYGSEISWVVGKRSLLNVVFASTPNEQNIVMTGGLLPASVRSKVPVAVAAASQSDYRDYRSYYSYACLPTGNYNLFSYDSYGDGWEGGRVTLAQVVNATTGCVLLAGGSPTRFNLTTPFAITADADTDSAACSSLTSPDGPYFYVEAGLVVLGEDTKTFTLAKQRRIKEGLAALLDVDTAQVTIQSLANATGQELTDGQSSLSAAAANRVPAGQSPAASALDVQHAAVRRLQGTASGEEDESEAPSGSINSIHSMLQQAQEDLFAASGSSSSSSSRVQELSKLAVSIPDLVASGVIAETQRQLHLAEQWLIQQQQEQQQAHEQDAYNQQQQPSPSTAAAPGGTSELRKLQQLLTLDDNGSWQDVTAPAAVDAVASETLGGASDGSNSTAVSANNSTESSSPDTPTTASNSSLSAAASDTGSSNISSSNISVSTGNSTTTSSGDGGVASALLSEVPLGPSAGASNTSGPVQVSELVQQLQALRPNKPPKNKPQTGSRGSRGGVRVVEVRMKNPSEAFGWQAAGGGGGARTSSQGTTTAAVPKPDAAASAVATTAASEFRPAQGAVANATADPQSLAPQHLPFIPHLNTQTGADNQTTFLLFDAVRPAGRALAQATKDDDDDGLPPGVGADDSSSDSSSQRVMVVADGSDSRVDPGLLVGPAQIDPSVLAEVITAGRAGPRGTPRTRPPANVWDHPSKDTKGRAGSGSSSSDAVVLASPSASSDASQQQQRRQLLQTTTPASKGVTVVVRINGYANASQAAAAEIDLRSAITNGSLSSHLWTGASVGLLYTSTGSVGLWGGQDMLRIIIGACVGGGVALCIVVGVWMHVRRRRAAGAAQVPGQQGQQHQQGPRTSVMMQGGGPAGAAAAPAGRFSYAPQGALYMSPQQAAAMVAPYPSSGSPYSRTASPSAPSMLTPSQQAALAAGAVPFGGPIGQPQQQYGKAGGRASVAGPAGGQYPSYAVASPPAQQQYYPQQQYQQQQQQYQQQQQQAGSYYPIHPAPMAGPQAAGSPQGGSGRSSPYVGGYSSSPQPVSGYPVIGPPGGR